MGYNKIWRILLLPVLVAAVVFLAVVSHRAEENSCLGVRILTEAEMSGFTELVPQELSGCIIYENEPAAIDAGLFNVYISQNIKEDTDYKNLVGSLKISHPGYSLYFAPDEMFDDIYTAVKDNHRFRLIVDFGSGAYMEYNVIFTILPVVRLTGPLEYVSPDSENIFSGTVTVWDGSYAGTGGNVTKSSGAQWKTDDVRDSDEADETLRISLTESGGKNMVDFMGMGREDDWVLNSLYGDDSKIREKLAAELWNGMNDSISNKFVQPQGEYAEVVYNGVYKGVYLLQRKADQKHFGLDGDDLLARDKKDRRGSYTQNNYTVLDGYYTEQEATDIIKPFHTLTDVSEVDIENWIDAHLFSNIVCNKGRTDYTEMYYIWQNTSVGRRIRMIPIISDSIFGMTFDKEENSYSFDENLNVSEVVYRREYDALKGAYPDLDKKIAQRYAEIREGVFNEKNIEVIIQELSAGLEASGALLRDKPVWKEDGENTALLYEYIYARLEYLDLYYNYNQAE